MKAYSKQVREYIKSTLFNSYYVERGFLDRYKEDWHPWESPAFNEYLTNVKAFIKSKDQNFFTKIQPSETTTIEKYIIPLMAFLGWDELKYGSSSNSVRETSFNYGGANYKPDILYFNNEKDAHKVDKIKKKDEQKKFVEDNLATFVEAKKFGLLKLNLAENDEKSDSTTGRSPEEQTIIYMEILRSRFGILTDGGIWKLFCDDFRDKNKYFSFDFGKLALLLLNASDEEVDKVEEFEYFATFFYTIFSKEALEGKIDRVDHLLSYSKKYSEHLQDKMKDRFILAMNYACNGLARALKEEGKDPEDYLDIIKSTAESHLFNIIFFRSLESRGVLPYYDQDNDYASISISKTVDEIYSNGFDPSENFDKQLSMFSDYFQEKVEKTTSKICTRLLQLYEKVNAGYKEFKISGFKESIFADREWTFAKKYKIDDQHMMNVYFYLSLVPKDAEETEYQLIPYDYLTPRELGSIYESFLEFKLIKANGDMFWDTKSKSWKMSNDRLKYIRSTEIIKKNDFYFSPDNSDRKMTGSYYTPENVVKFIVKNALQPLVENKKPSEILDIKLIDPAMGSGHFLSTSLDFLTAKYLEAFSKTNPSKVPTYENAIREVLDSCIYGSDINPSAVKLGKMSLWLLTAYADVKLERLEDQIKCLDALDSNWKSEFPKVYKNGGFDAVVGNPPYGVLLKGDSAKKAEKKYHSFVPNRDIYSAFVEEGFTLLKKGGVISFIIPSSWLANNQFKNMREVFLKHRVEQVITMPDRVFADAVIDTLVFQAKNELVSDNQVHVKILPKKFDLNDLQKPIKFSKMAKKQWVESPDFGIVLGGDALRVIERLRKTGSGTLADAIECKRGVLASKSLIKNAKSSEDDFRLFEGGVDRYSLETNLGGWLKFGPTLPECPKDDKWFKGERILLRRVMGKSNRLICAFTDKKYITTKNFYTILPKKDSLFDIYCLMGLLNSKVLSYLYRNLNPQANKAAFPQITIGDLGSLPLPSNMKTKGKELKEISRFVEKLVTENKVTEEQDNRIDQLVYELYELSDDEVSEIEEFFNPQTAPEKSPSRKKAA